SELSVGYCTMYGDMSGGLTVLADVPKTLVYKIALWVNENKGEAIPQAILDKPPSAELRPNQTDQDTLPAYDMLDSILNGHVELHESKDELLTNGFEAEALEKVIGMFNKAEFKRKQCPPGIKITDRAFGAGWRMPIARGVTA
ncbi:MAG: NAD(+) synthase, partial [Bacteroidota bacterium]